ncbi:MAG: phospholipase D-like domain-containing protein [Nitrososphaerota archaeon]
MIYSADDDLINVITSFIRKARRKLYVCSYLLSLPFFMAELVNKKRAGIDVKVLLANDSSNIPAVNFLRSNKVDVRLVYQTRGRLHAKFIIADNKAMITTCNYTHDGLNNNKELAVILSRHDVRKLEEIFHQWWRENH